MGYVLIVPNLAGMVGTVLLTRSSDRFGERIWHLVIPLLLGGAGAAAAGFWFGNVYLVVAALSFSLFGAAAGIPLFWNLPTAFLGTAGAAGSVALINSIGTSQGYLAPQITGWLRDLTGGYTAPLLLTGAVLVVAAGLVLASGIAVHLRVPAERLDG